MLETPKNSPRPQGRKPTDSSGGNQHTISTDFLVNTLANSPQGKKEGRSALVRGKVFDVIRKLIPNNNTM